MTDLNTIWLCGDVHGDLRPLKRALQHAARPPAALLFLGDLQPDDPVGDWIEGAIGNTIPWWFIHGNHDTDAVQFFLDVFHGKGAERNLDGRVLDLDGLRVAGLGGVFRGQVWMPPEAPRFKTWDAYYDDLSLRVSPAGRHVVPALEGLPGRPIFNPRLRAHRSTIFPATYEHLADLQADVLLVHEAPSCHPHGFEALDLLARVMGVHTVAHGHQHDALDYSTDTARLGFRTIGVGLRGITTLAGEVIVPGELDAARAGRRLHERRVADPITNPRESTWH